MEFKKNRLNWWIFQLVERSLLTKNTNKRLIDLRFPLYRANRYKNLRQMDVLNTLGWVRTERYLGSSKDRDLSIRTNEATGRHSNSLKLYKELRYNHYFGRIVFERMLLQIRTMTLAATGIRRQTCAWGRTVETHRLGASWLLLCPPSSGFPWSYNLLTSKD